MNNLLVLNSVNRFIGNVSSEDLSRLLKTNKHCWQTWTHYTASRINDWKQCLV